MDHQQFLHNYIFYGSIYRLRKDKIVFAEIKQMILTSYPLTKNDFRVPPRHNEYSISNEYSIQIYNYLIKEDLIVPNWSPILFKDCIVTFFTDYFINKTRVLKLYNINIFAYLDNFKNHKEMVFKHIIKYIQPYVKEWTILNISIKEVSEFIRLCIFYLDDKPTAFIPIKSEINYTENSLLFTSIINILIEWKKHEYRLCDTRINIIKEEFIQVAWHPYRIKKWYDIGGIPLIRMLGGYD